MFKLAVTLALALAVLLGCTTAQQQSSIAALEVGLTAAETTATNYAKLPSCMTTPTPPICSNPAFIAVLQGYDNTAYSAIKAAEAQIVAGGSADLTAATAALAAFQAAITTLPKGN